MTPPKKPKNEARRLAVLWQYDVLDTMPEQAFDDLTQLAATICGAPIASLSILGEDKQWFKSRVGLSRSETSRDISFCGHAILQKGLFIVPDALKDRRFADNPLVTADPRIRFYAGAPLITADGHALGALCVIDKVPRTLTESQKSSLLLLARHVMLLLELRRQVRDLQSVRINRGPDAAARRAAPGKKRGSAGSQSARPD
ncbi:MAG: GAF domain-containing protein [Verrucomicrobia bacterium]|nr:GAF domain-containing protein [Verrucomicrobiota bacterium]